jgi:hypothetical protein
MLTPDQITDRNVREIVLPLLRAQAAYTADYIKDEVGRWSPDFVSDDGQDYVTAACDLVRDLTYLAYEGSADELRDFLFVRWDDETTHGTSPLSQGYACDGICPELYPYFDATTE